MADALEALALARKGSRDEATDAQHALQHRGAAGSHADVAGSAAAEEEEVSQTHALQHATLRTSDTSSPTHALRGAAVCEYSERGGPSSSISSSSSSTKLLLRSETDAASSSALAPPHTEALGAPRAAEDSCLARGGGGGGGAEGGLVEGGGAHVEGRMSSMRGERERLPVPVLLLKGNALGALLRR